jgi:plasmid maintenance system antidote protein VapI
MSSEFWLGQQMDYDLEAVRAAIGQRLDQEVTPRAA